MWSPFKHMYKIIEQTIANPRTNSLSSLEVCLKRNKQTFVNLLKNPVSIFIFITVYFIVIE